MQCTYSRTTLYKDENIEIVLIEWRPGDKSPIHKHDRCNFAIVKVLEGKIYETKFEDRGDVLVEDKKNHYTVGQMISENCLDVHEIGNDTEQNAKTLHIYMPRVINIPLEKKVVRWRKP